MTDCTVCEYIGGDCVIECIDDVPGCPVCGSKREPEWEMEVLPDGDFGAGIYAVCPDCGYGEM